MNWLAPLDPVLRRAENMRTGAGRKREWMRNPENRARRNAMIRQRRRERRA